MPVIALLKDRNKTIEVSSTPATVVDTNTTITTTTKHLEGRTAEGVPFSESVVSDVRSKHHAIVETPTGRRTKLSYDDSLTLSRGEKLTLLEGVSSKTPDYSSVLCYKSESQNRYCSYHMPDHFVKTELFSFSTLMITLLGFLGIWWAVGAMFEDEWKDRHILNASGVLTLFFWFWANGKVRNFKKANALELICKIHNGDVTGKEHDIGRSVGWGWLPKTAMITGILVFGTVFGIYSYGLLQMADAEDYYDENIAGRNVITEQQMEWLSEIDKALEWREYVRLIDGAQVRGESEFLEKLFTPGGNDEKYDYFMQKHWKFNGGNRVYLDFVPYRDQSYLDTFDYTPQWISHYLLGGQDTGKLIAVLMWKTLELQEYLNGERADNAYARVKRFALKGRKISSLNRDQTVMLAIYLMQNLSAVRLDPEWSSNGCYAFFRDINERFAEADLKPLHKANMGGLDVILEKNCLEWAR